MRTKKHRKTHKKSHHSKRRKNGGGWFTNIFKSKSQKAAEQAEQERQLEIDRVRQQKIAERDIAVTAEKNIVEKQWQKENEEGWETPEELQNKIKQFSAAELAKRTNNQKAINLFLQKEIATMQNDLDTCYPNGKVVIEKAKMKDLQDELYMLKDKETNFRLERKVLKNMIKTTPACKSQKKMAKQKYQMASTGEDMPIRVQEEPEDIYYDTEETALPVAVKEEIATGEEIDPEEFMLVSPEAMQASPQNSKSTLETCDDSYYTPDELNVCKAYSTIKEIIVQLIDSGDCAEIYLKPEKFYELVKKKVLDALLQGNWLSVRAKMTAITLFLKAYPGIKNTVIRTLTETRVFKALCEGVLENPNIDINSLAETFTNQLINSIIDNLITEYNTNPKVRDNIQWLQTVYYSYFDKNTMRQYSMGGKRKKVNVSKRNKKVSRKRKTVNKRKKVIKCKTRRYK